MTCCGGSGNAPRPKSDNKALGLLRLAQAELRIGTLEPHDPKVQARRRECERCESWDHGRCMHVDPAKGRACECYTWAKTLFETEACPKGAW